MPEGPRIRTDRPLSKAPGPRSPHMQEVYGNTMRIAHPWRDHAIAYAGTVQRMRSSPDRIGNRHDDASGGDSLAIENAEMAWKDRADNGTIQRDDVRKKSKGGQGEIRTRGLYHAKVTIFQLIYLPSKDEDIILVFKSFCHSGPCRSSHGDWSGTCGPHRECMWGTSR